MIASSLPARSAAKSATKKAPRGKSVARPSAAATAISAPPSVGSVGESVVTVVWQNILQSDLMAILQQQGINPPIPSTGVFIDYRYWAYAICQWAIAQTDDNGDSLYIFGLPSWETGADSNNNPVLGAFLFPVGMQVTLHNPTDDDLNTALHQKYYNFPWLSLTSAQTGDPDERRWAAAAHAYALTHNDASGNPYVAGIPNWEMTSDGSTNVRGVYCFSNTSGIQVLKAGRAALMDQISAGLLEPAQNPNLMDTDMRTLAVAANRWAMRYGSACGAATFGYCSTTGDANDLFIPYGYFMYTHDIVICFASQQPTGNLLQDIVDQPAVAWPDFDNAYAGLCTVLGNINNPGSNTPLDPRSLWQKSSWDPSPVAGQLYGCLVFTDGGNSYSLSEQGLSLLPSGVTADDWLNIIYTVYMELCSVGQLQSLNTYLNLTLTQAQQTSQNSISAAIANLQTKTQDTVLVDALQLLASVGSALIWFLPEDATAGVNLVDTVATDLVSILTSNGGGAPTQITVGDYWETVNNAYNSSINNLDTFYTTIAGDHGRLTTFYAYVDSGALTFPASANTDVANGVANGMLLQTYQTLMPLYWGLGWAGPTQSNPAAQQALYGDYHKLLITEAPEGTYVEGPYYELALIWTDSGIIKTYPGTAMMTDLTTTLNLNLMDILARSGGWLGTPAWFGWVDDGVVNLNGPYTR